MFKRWNQNHRIFRFYSKLKRFEMILNERIFREIVIIYGRRIFFVLQDIDENINMIIYEVVGWNASVIQIPTESNVIKYTTFLLLFFSDLFIMMRVFCGLFLILRLISQCGEIVLLLLLFCCRCHYLSWENRMSCFQVKASEV